METQTALRKLKELADYDKVFSQLKLKHLKVWSYRLKPNLEKIRRKWLKSNIRSSKIWLLKWICEGEGENIELHLQVRFVSMIKVGHFKNRSVRHKTKTELKTNRLQENYSQHKLNTNRVCFAVPCRTLWFLECVTFSQEEFSRSDCKIKKSFGINRSLVLRCRCQRKFSSQLYLKKTGEDGANVTLERTKSNC